MPDSMEERMQYATGQAVHDVAVPRAYSQADARELLGGICRTTLYRLICAGKIRAIKIGGRLMIPSDEIERIVVEGTE
jgi:excisionase family DNA binding protein